MIPRLSKRGYVLVNAREHPDICVLRMTWSKSHRLAIFSSVGSTFEQNSRSRQGLISVICSSKMCHIAAIYTVNYDGNRRKLIQLESRNIPKQEHFITIIDRFKVSVNQSFAKFLSTISKAFNSTALSCAC
jgi:hypothetical protein